MMECNGWMATFPKLNHSRRNIESFDLKAMALQEIEYPAAAATTNIKGATPVFYECYCTLVLLDAVFPWETLAVPLVGKLVVALCDLSWSHCDMELTGNMPTSFCGY